MNGKQGDNLELLGYGRRALALAAVSVAAGVQAEPEVASDATLCTAAIGRDVTSRTFIPPGLRDRLPVT